MKYIEFKLITNNAMLLVNKLKDFENNGYKPDYEFIVKDYLKANNILASDKIIKEIIEIGRK